MTSDDFDVFKENQLGERDELAELRAENERLTAELALPKQATRCHEHADNNHTRHCVVCGIPLAVAEGAEPTPYRMLAEENQLLRQELDEAREQIDIFKKYVYAAMEMQEIDGDGNQ